MAVSAALLYEYKNRVFKNNTNCRCLLFTSVVSPTLSTSLTIPKGQLLAIRNGNGSLQRICTSQYIPNRTDFSKNP